MPLARVSYCRSSK